MLEGRYKKRLIILLVMILSLIMLSGVVLFAKFLVESADKRKVEPHIMKETEVTETESEVRMPLYEGDDTRLIEGDSLNYQKVLGVIESEAKDVFSTIGEISYDYSDMKMLGVINNDMLGFSSGEFLKYRSFFIENSLTVIGVFSNNYVVMAYNYPKNPGKELIVIEYSDAKWNREGLIAIGGVHSLRGVRSGYVLKEIEGYYVMFYKG